MSSYKKGDILKLRGYGAGTGVIRVRKDLGKRVEVDVASTSGWKKWHSSIPKKSIDYKIKF